jgi:3-methyladenine DNA glycosylase AlkD
MAKKTLAEHGMFTEKKLEEFVERCYDQDYREVVYVGIEMMQRMLAKQSKAWITVLEKCIVTNSWWDTVDWLAKLTGIHFRNYPELQHKYCYKWIESKNIWLQRVAIIHQLFYRKQTDENLLFDLIRCSAANKEFFIRKACGWALRQYSRTNPSAVIEFVESEKLSNLTTKEALRLID